MLRRRVTIRQADTVLTAGQGIAWIIRARLPKTGFRVLVYLENNVRLEGADQTHNRPVLLHELALSSSKPTVRILRKQNADTPLNRDPLYRRATVRRQRRPDDHKLVTYQAEMVPAPMANDAPQRLRRVQLFPRTNRPFNVTTAPSSGTMPREKVVVITGGVNVVIDGVTPDKTQALFGAETVDLSADRVVIWTQSDDDQPVTSQLVQAAKRPFQVYMEGNIEVRSGGNVIRARRALYDAREHRGLMLDADLLAKLPGGRVPLRIRAEKIRKEGKHSFHAHNAWASTSPFGVPGYRLEARDVFLNRRSWPQRRPGGLDPITEQPAAARRSASLLPPQPGRPRRSGSQFSTATGQVPAGQRVRVPDQDDLEPVLPAFDRANRRSRLVAPCRLLHRSRPARR